MHPAKSSLSSNSDQFQANELRLKHDFEAQPVRFEVNSGQTDKHARYFVRNAGYTAFYAPSEIVLALRHPSVSTRENNGSENAVLRMKLNGSNKNVAIIGESELPGKSNYYIGNDPRKWITNVSAYRAVRYKQIYDGIDLVHHGTNREVEYDFEVAPGADPSQIKMSFAGVNDLRVDSDGNLVFRTVNGQLKHSKPHVYQEVDGVQTEVAAQFKQHGKSVTFEVENYNRSLTLTIDPTLTYSTFLGGTGPDVATSIALDASGNAYIAGYTGSLDFPQVNAARTRSSNDECFVSKLNATGTALIFSTYLGGSDLDRAYAIAVDSGGAAYITGQTFSNNYPNTAANVGSFLRGTNDAFVSKLTSLGALTYSTYLGGDGTGTDIGNSIAVDSSNQIYVTGYTENSTFPTFNAVQGTIASFRDAFVSKIAAAGNAFIYSTFLGGNANDSGNAITVDSSGNAYIAGETPSTNFPTTAGVIKTANSATDAFVTKFNATGGRTYSTYFGGVNSLDKANAIAIDSSGNVYLTGSTNFCCTTSDFPVVSAAQSTPGGSLFDDAFVTKINSTATAIIYSTFLGGTSPDFGNSITVDSSNNAYVTGYTLSTNFPVVNPLMPALNGNSDAFVTKIGPLGSFGFSTYLGGTTNDEGKGIALDSSGNVYVVGHTNISGGSAPNFPTTTGAFQTSGNGTSEDAFVVKLSQAGVSPFILGTVSTVVGDLLPNVSLGLTGNQTKSVLSDANGRYVFQLLPAGTYTVTPSYNYIFNPPNRVFTNLTTQQSSADFTAVTLVNDNLANAISLTGQLGTSYYGANFGATKECTEAPHAGNPSAFSVWYKWTAPPISTQVFVSTAGSAIDTLMDVYPGTNINVCSLPAPIASNDDSSNGDGTSRLSFLAVANTQYYIAVDSRSPGPFKLNISQAVAIRGKAKNVNGRGLSGITINLNGEVSASTKTNQNGDYVFSVPLGGNYTVSASDTSVQLWAPSDITLNDVEVDANGNDFTATTPSPSITGEIKNLSQGIADLQVSVGGSGLVSKPCTITNNAGVFTYSCVNLNVHGDYVVSSSSSIYGLTPSDHPFSDLLGNILQGPASDFTAGLVPTVTTNAATAIGTTTATLNGIVNPHGDSTVAAFQWATNPLPGPNTQTSFQTVGAGNVAVPVSASLTGLSAGTTYFFRTIASNSNGSPSGNVLSFTTAPIPNTIQFSATGFSASEGNAQIAVSITRPVATTAASVDYATSDTAVAGCDVINHLASSRCDYLLTLGTLQFAVGETSKTINIPIVDDVYAEGTETFTLTLSNPVGATLGAPAVATLTINDNDSSTGVNPLDTPNFFVHQHYVDFLNREPDASGLNHWTTEITGCGADAQCIEVKRINVSAAFFLSIEFQETGYLVYRIYKTGFGNLPGAPVPVRFIDFLRDTQQIGLGVQVGIGDWQTQLETNKQAYAFAFVQRSDFLAAFPTSMTADQFVTQLDTRAGGVLSTAEKSNLVAVLGSTPNDLSKRASVLRSVAENSNLRASELNKAFVLMQYFGYLRRNPNDAPDSNFDGLNFWLGKLNQFNGNFVNAEMVKAFLVSDEYRHRFGP